jgi:hypothetical protein
VSKECLGEAIRRHLANDGRLPCAAAFRVAEELGLVPLAVGQEANVLEIKLSRCQLGLFGYGSKRLGQHRVLKPAAAVSPGLAQAIHDSLAEGGLPCRTAWELAAALRVAKGDVAAAAESLGIKITRCQLGAF